MGVRDQRVSLLDDLEAPFFPVQWKRYQQSKKEDFMQNSVEVGKSINLPRIQAIQPSPGRFTAKNPHLLLPGVDGQDVFTLATDGHRVGLSKREAVIQHPCDCGFRGSRMDKFKTFHHWPSFLVYADKCKLNIAQEVMDKLEGEYKEMRKNARY